MDWVNQEPVDLAAAKLLLRRAREEVKALRSDTGAAPESACVVVPRPDIEQMIVDIEDSPGAVQEQLRAMLSDAPSAKGEKG